MLFLIGLGLKPKHLTLEALDAIKSCENVFAEEYTSRYGEGSIKDLEKITEKKITVFSRKKVEDEMKNILLNARDKNSCLLCFGNPLTATTHIEFLIQAKKQGIPIQVIEGISVTNALSRTGLDEYRFGRTTTIAEPKPNFSPTSFYDFIEQNQKLGLHTLCLLDTGDGEEFMSTKRGLEILEGIEKKKRKSVLKNSFIVLVAGLGSENEKIFGAKFDTAKAVELSVFPQSIVVCGKLTEKEKEALRKIYGFKT